MVEEVRGIRRVAPVPSQKAVVMELKERDQGSLPETPPSNQRLESASQRSEPSDERGPIHSRRLSPSPKCSFQQRRELWHAGGVGVVAECARLARGGDTSSLVVV